MVSAIPGISQELIANSGGIRYPLPIKPSIAVLPFDNMSGDPEQDYIADGISENIISTLSKIPDLLVISRNSTFVYKDRVHVFKNYLY